MVRESSVTRSPSPIRSLDLPSQSLLSVLAKFTEDKEEKEMVTVLANDDVMYEKWREDLKVRTFKEVSEERSNIHSCVGVAQ